jgi:NAD(P)-dependent dehydrogenase (short-subunit alcohol dehydrogenase family)
VPQLLPKRLHRPTLRRSNAKPVRKSLKSWLLSSTKLQPTKYTVVLVTGVSQNGLGISTAKAFAIHHPALLILAARSQAALDAAVSTIKEAVPDCPTRVLNLDLGNIRTVRAAAAEVNSWHDVPKIDILINNAAAAAEMSWKLSEDGIEHHFATNHIGPFLFTNLIVGKVIAAKGRVVNVSSVGHVSSGIRFNDPNFKVSQSLSREIL